MASAKLPVAVLGGGIAGLATAFDIESGAAARGLPIEVTVFESAPEPGGHLRTVRDEGCLLEWGPNGFLDSEPATLDLVDGAGLRDRLQKSEDATRRRFLLLDGQLRQLPTTPPAFLRSDLLPWRAKLRMAGEFFMPRRRQDPAGAEESVHDFGCRRLGRDFAERLLDPMVKGISGGNSRTLGLAAAFPRIASLEAEHGSLLRAMIRLQGRKKREGRDRAGQGGAGGPAGTLHSFTGGMADLPRGLVGALRGEVLCEAEVTSVESGGDTGSERPRYFVTTGTGSRQRRHGPFDAIVDATPAHAAARHHGDGRLASLLGSIPYAPIVVVTLQFDRDRIAHSLDGFGMLIPSSEGSRLLGVLWSASIFSGRAPDGSVLLRCMVGGAGDPTVLDLDDEALHRCCLDLLTPLYGINGTARRSWIVRHRRAIAQYDVGHLATLRAIDEELATSPGLFLTGSSYRGIAVNHCAADARRCADQVLGWLGESLGIRVVG